MAELPTSNVKRIIVSGAGDIRISAEAVAKGIESAEKFLNRLGSQAASIARAHQRKTIMPEDIETASRLLLP